MADRFADRPNSGEELACMVEIKPDDPEWREVSRLVEERSKQFVRHYGFGLEIKRLRRVLCGRLQREQRRMAEALGSPTLLFHGTSSSSMESILKGGFRLPKGSGMFGRGVYFAHCPLKCVQFASKAAMEGSAWWSALCCLGGCALGCSAGIAGCVTGSVACCCGGCMGACAGGCLGGCAVGGLGCGLACLNENSQQILLCEVFLGNSLTLIFPRDVDPSDDLKRGWLPRLLGARDYNSVYAPGGFLTAVRVAEYIAYEPHQAIPRYVIEFSSVKT